MTFYIFLGIALVGATLTTFYARKLNKSSATGTPEFVSFQTIYLVAYFLAMFGDWLQGPYVYALYDDYGYSQDEIAVLFVAGFGSSMFFGTFIGSLADKMGRKKFALLYCILYIASCMTKHFSDYKVLMLGRVLGGISTSLLFSVFDSWMIAEHNARGSRFMQGSSTSSELLGDTFSKAMFGNSVVAIFSGLIAEPLSQNVEHRTMTIGSQVVSFGRFTVPFDLASLFLLGCFVVINLKWSENFGERQSDAGRNASFGSEVAQAFHIIMGNKAVLNIGIVSAIFEASMYSFVFMWTPLLTENEGTHDVPFGVIFATFMLACMMGSSIFSVLTSQFKYSAQKILEGMLVVAAAAMVIPLLGGSFFCMVGFCIFEVCVGIYWPAMGTCKGMFVPEDNRSGIYNVFRVPLNALVLGVLLTHLSSETVFVICGGLLGLASIFAKKITNDSSPVKHAEAVKLVEKVAVDSQV